MSKISVEEINSFDEDAFIALLEPLFEHSLWIIAEAWCARPFTGTPHLYDALCGVVLGAPLEQQVALIRAYPDLVGKAALAGVLTSDSLREHASAGLERLSTNEIETFGRMNQAYHTRFDFPFVICVRENRKESILTGFKTRMHHTREAEIATALGEIIKISHLRLLDRVRE